MTVSDTCNNSLMRYICNIFCQIYILLELLYFDCCFIYRQRTQSDLRHVFQYRMLILESHWTKRYDLENDVIHQVISSVQIFLPLLSNTVVVYFLFFLLLLKSLRDIALL